MEIQYSFLFFQVINNEEEKLKISLQCHKPSFEFLIPLYFERIFSILTQEKGESFKGHRKMKFQWKKIEEIGLRLIKN